MSSIVGSQTNPQAYGEFIQQLQLREFWLHSATIENPNGPVMPESGRLSISIEDGELRWEPAQGGFRAFHGYVVRIAQEDDTHYATVAVTFGLEFSSTEEMSDELFRVFSTRNLPVNTWPFLREFFYTTLGRMGWAPLTLPVLKARTPAEPASPVQDKTRSKTKRKKALQPT
jgi:hypothetical protein